jgi:hypothetical protein
MTSAIAVFNRLFDRSNHDLSVVNAVYTVSSGTVVLIGVQVKGWFRDQAFSFPVVGMFLAMLVLLIFYVAASNKRPASSRFLLYAVAALISSLFPWIAMRLTLNDLRPQYFQLWLYPIGLAAWALTRETSIMLCNILNWKGTSE